MAIIDSIQRGGLINLEELKDNTRTHKEEGNRSDINDAAPIYFQPH